MVSRINSTKLGKIRDHSAGIWDHKPWDRDQYWFFDMNKDHKILESTLIGRTCQHLRCFDTVVRRPYRYFLIALNGILSLSDCYKMIDTLLCISSRLYQVYAANPTQIEFRDPKKFLSDQGSRFATILRPGIQNKS